MISSVYLISRVWGLTGLISFTMIENYKGPSTVPWGAPLLTLRKLVTTPSTTTLCRGSHRKLIIQYLIYGLMSYDANLLNRMRWETESKALLKLNEKALTKATSWCSRSSQKCWHLIRAIVVLCPFLYGNWSGPINDLKMGDTSCLQTRCSKILSIMLVNEIGLSYLHSVRVDSLGMGEIFASFHRDGTV